MLGIIEVRRREEDGVAIIGEAAGHVEFSLGLLYEGTADPRWLTIEDGLVVLRGVDNDGQPRELRYRPVGFNPPPAGYEAMNEGGALRCERVQ